MYILLLLSLHSINKSPPGKVTFTALSIVPSIPFGLGIFPARIAATVNAPIEKARGCEEEEEVTNKMDENVKNFKVSSKNRTQYHIYPGIKILNK